MVGNGRSVDVANNRYSDQWATSRLSSPSWPPNGDYNNNGVVDTADYVVWRKAESLGLNTLDNRGPGIVGAVGQLDYNFWRSHFGNTSTITIPASGSGGVLAAEATSIEPAASSAAPVAAAKARDSALVDWPSSSTVVKAETLRTRISDRGLSAKPTATALQLLLAEKYAQKRDGTRTMQIPMRVVAASNPWTKSSASWAQGGRS